MRIDIVNQVGEGLNRLSTYTNIAGGAVNGKSK